MSGLEDSTIIVTGASRGLGHSMVKRFAEEGARLTLTARDADRMSEIADDLPTEAVVVAADIRDSEAVQRVVERSITEFGRVDTLVNNAGVSLLGHQDARKEIVNVSEDEWDTVLDINLKGVFLFTRAVLPQMYDQGHGNIINISSGLGQGAISGASCYVSSKWGLEGFTRVTALEGESHGVLANSLYPGGRVNTDIWAHLPDDEREEILQPDVLNDAAVQLAAQEPGGISGESMPAEDWERRFS